MAIAKEVTIKDIKFNGINVDEFSGGSYQIERCCIVCKNGFNLLGPSDPRTICPDCCNAIKNLKDNSKRNWIPDSKGGEPNFRKK